MSVKRKLIEMQSVSQSAFRHIYLGSGIDIFWKQVNIFTYKGFVTLRRLVCTLNSNYLLQNILH